MTAGDYQTVCLFTILMFVCIVGYVNADRIELAFRKWLIFVLNGVGEWLRWVFEFMSGRR